MKTNVNVTGRAIRFSVAAIIIVLFCYDLINGTLAIVLVILAVVLFASSIIGLSALYFIFRISSDRKKLE